MTYPEVSEIRTEWTPEQISPTPPHFAVVEGPRRSLIGEPCNAACECGWKGTVYSFGQEIRRVANAREDARTHERLMNARPIPTVCPKR